MNLSHILVARGLLNESQLNDALALQRAEGLRLDRALVQLGLITEKQLLELMSQQLDLPLVQLQDLTIEPDVLRSLPSKVVYRKRLVPISRENGVLNVATSDAFDLYAFDDLRLSTGLDVRPVLAPRDDIEKLIKTHYGLGGDTLDEMVGADGLEAMTNAVEGGEDLLGVDR